MTDMLDFVGMIALYLAAALVVGLGLGAWWGARRRASGARDGDAELARRLARAEAGREQLALEMAATDARARELEVDVSALKAQLVGARTWIAEHTPSANASESRAASQQAEVERLRGRVAALEAELAEAVVARDAARAALSETEPELALALKASPRVSKHAAKLVALRAEHKRTLTLLAEMEAARREGGGRMDQRGRAGGDRALASR